MKAVVAIISTLVTLNVAEPPPPSSYQTSPLLGLNINSVLSNSYAPAPAPIRSSYGAPSSEYGAPPPEEQPQQPPPQEQYGPPQEQYGPPPPQQYGAPVKTGPIIHRHVYIHSAPDEVSYPESKIIRVGGEPEKHVNIIFVKAPSSSSQTQTEVIIPEPPQQRTLVYVLVKKPESINNVRVSGPQPTKPPKPEVYFIRYKGNEGGYSSPSPAPAYGPPEIKSGYN